MNNTEGDHFLVEKEQNKFINLIESDSNPIFIIDSMNVIKMANQQVFQKFGFNSDETLGMNLKFLIKSTKIDSFEKALTKFYQGDGSNQNSIKISTTALNKLKEDIPVKIKISVLDQVNNHPKSAIVRVLTDNKNADALLEKYTQLLEAKNKELEQFAYVASHDLKEPVRTIKSFTEFLSENYKDKFDERGLKSMKFINEASERMNMLISDLLDYSRIGRNSERATTNLNNIVNSVIADLNSTIEEANAEIEFSDLPECKVYPTEMRLLFQNLIENAVKFRKPDVASKIKIDSVKTPKEIEISISDNGIGIEEKFQERIFMVFQRLHTRDNYEGSGIGLAHCKKIIEFHGGRIWVKSNPDQGSTFIFTIPI